MDIETIKYKDKELPFFFSWRTYKKCLKSAAGSEDDMDMFEYGIFLGLELGASKKGVPFEIKQEDIIDMFEEDTEFQEKASELFAVGFDKQKKIQLKMMAIMNPSDQ